MKLAGKVALITGGSKGIGLATAQELARNGASLVIAARHRSSLVSASQLIQMSGQKCLFFCGDVADPEQVYAMVHFTFEQFGHLDIVVTCAGINIRKRTLETSIDEWNQVIAVNLAGVFYTCKFAAEIMATQRSGNIITISSVQGKMGGTSPHYSASKAGVLGLTRSLARELAPLGIRVNAVAPGGVETEMANLWSPQRRHQLVEETLLNRIALPEEIAHVVAFLASDESSYITGETININGGLLMD